MNRRLLACAAVLFFLLVPQMWAQDVTGDWQGAVGAGNDRLRFVLHVERDLDQGLKATFYSIDQGADGIPVTQINAQGAEFAFKIDALKLSFHGTVNADASSITGNMKQGGASALTLRRPTPATAWSHDFHCACTVSFIPVDKGVTLEVLDWGGTGRPMVLLGGLGDTAHGFDDFAHKLAARYHVYGITRRGFGESSAPAPTDANYSANRLGDDVLAVISALHLERPILAGHSIAGEELSSIGSRYPEKIAALIYLDAAFEYAFYNPADGDVHLDAAEVRRELGDFVDGQQSTSKAIAELLAQLPVLERELKAQQERTAMLPSRPQEAQHVPGAEEAILLGQQKFTKITCPVLAIIADPHELGPMKELNAAGRAAMTTYLEEHTVTARQRFTAGVPAAKIVVIPHADHYIFHSNEAEVLKAIDSFVATLKP